MYDAIFSCYSIDMNRFPHLNNLYNLHVPTKVLKRQLTTMKKHLFLDVKPYFAHTLDTIMHWPGNSDHFKSLNSSQNLICNLNNKI